jgi:uncharacterized protein
MRIGGRWSSGNVRVRSGGMGGKIAGGGIGAVILTILALAMGVDPGVVLQGGGGESQSTPLPADAEPGAQFVTRVLGTTEGVWTQIFQEEFGQDYPEPMLNLFSGAVQSACGFAQAAVGPFYCPLDQQVYIDLSFYSDLADQLGAEGDFAQAYVIAHEVGHHVQTVLGISEQVNRRSGAVGEGERNALSVLQELQADCFAGVWANRVSGLQEVTIESGDIEEALNAASAIGDDRLQRQSQGYVVPESFTHGSSAQRVEWFTRGYQSGEISNCDTFAGQTV